MTNEVCIHTLGHSLHNLLILTHADLALLSVPSAQCNIATLFIFLMQEKMALKTCRCCGSIKGGSQGPKEVLRDGTWQKGIVAGIDGTPSPCSSVDVADRGTTQ